MSRERRKPDNVVPLRSQGTEPVLHPLLGQVVGLSDQGEILVTHPQCPNEALVALTTMALSEAELEELCAKKTPVLLAFIGGAPERPVIVGVIQPLPNRGSARAPSGDQGVRAHVDEETVVLEGKQRVELRCGKASIVLDRSGKIILRGTYISAGSSGAHRIRGGSVEIN